MKNLILTQGYIALIDDEDYAAISQYKWRVQKGNSTFYAVRWEHSENPSGVHTGKGRTRKMIYLHRQLLNITDSNVMVDHEDHNGLNCQRRNIRIATSADNAHNTRSHKNAVSKYKGVSKVGPALSKVSKKKWRARIGGKTIGYFKSAKEAAQAYDKAAAEKYGKFAYPNSK